MDLDVGNPFLWAFEGVGPEISTFLGPKGTRYARSHFRAQKSLVFRAYPFKHPSFWIAPPSKSIRPVPPHINNRFINSYYVMADEGSWRYQDTWEHRRRICKNLTLQMKEGRWEYNLNVFFGISTLLYCVRRTLGSTAGAEGRAHWKKTFFLIFY